MLAIIKNYCRFVLAGRLWFLFSFELFLAIAVCFTVVAVRFSTFDLSGSVLVSLVDAAKLLGTYGALGMGTCLTTLALAARFSSSDFNEYYRQNVSDPNPAIPWASYSELILKLSFAALSHWLALMAGLFISVFTPPDWRLLPRTNDPVISTVLSGTVVFLFTYCVMNFLSALLGLSVLCMIRKNFQDVN